MNYGIRVVETLFLLNFIDQMGTNKIYISEISLISMSVESIVLAGPSSDDQPHAGGYIFANIEVKMVWFRVIPFFSPFLVDF